MLFIGLSPSEATEKKEDQTLRRLIDFCMRWDYGSLVVVNLFARISKSPRLLRGVCDPIGNRNNYELRSQVLKWSINPSWDLWLGWGVRGSWFNRNLEVMRYLKNDFANRNNQLPKSNGPLSLGLTLEGHPCHPLYISNKEVLKPFDWKVSLANLAF